MSRLYPTLEDMRVDQMATAQHQHAAATAASSNAYAPNAPAIAAYPSPQAQGGHALYPDLASWFGVDLAAVQTEQNLSLVPAQGQQITQYPSLGGASGAIMVAPITGGDIGLRRAEVSHGIRELVLCKDQKGKIGIRVREYAKGVFVQFVESGSPASVAGLRLGDQILQIDGENVAGWSSDKTVNRLKKCPPNGIRIAVRDRPFERTITLHKDSSGHIGFVFKNGKITAVVKDSSAARNGLLTEHQLLEVNGQNVVGLKDKEITDIIMRIPNSAVTITIMPSILFDSMMKHMSSSLVKNKMDHSIPDV